MTKLALVVFSLSILAFAESPELGVKESIAMADEKIEYPEVLLEDVVKEFDYLIGRIGHHAIMVGDEVYIQPHVYLSFHLIQMRAAGWKDTDFDQIAAVSGASALFAYEHGTFDPKYAHHLIGMDERITEATGFGYEWVRFSDIDEAWVIIKESVDSGRSVKGWFWENIMFAGYQDADKPEDRKVFAISDGPETFAEWWSWEKFDKEYIKLVTGWGATGLGRYTERVPTKPANAVALRVIKDLVEWSTNPPEQILKKYPKATFGIAGIELYAKNCADMEKFEDFGSCHDINPQWHIRNSSSVYLKRVSEAKVFPEKVNVHILKAADEYKNAYVYWKQFYNHLSYGGGEGWGKIAEHRIAGADGISKALEHEKLALAEFKTILDMEDIAEIEQERDQKTVIDNMDIYHIIDPMVEGVRIILTQKGEKYSPAYIQGISKIAFQVAGICPCAPTCGSAMGPEDLLKTLGYEYEHLPLSGDGIEPDKEVHKVVARIKDEIRAGNPVLVWHAFTNAEWDMVYGFDEEKKQFLGRGSYAGNDKEYAAADETRMSKCGHICDPMGVIIIGKKTGEFDPRKAELTALRWAVDHSSSIRGKDQLGGDKWVFLEGLMAYDRWSNDFKNPEKKRGTGDSYCYGIFKSTHRSASDFLKEIAPNYPEASEHLNKAAEYFKAEADILDSGADLLWWNAPEGPDPERNAKASELLGKARDNYASGIQEIEKALEVINKLN